MARKQFDWKLPESIENRLGKNSYGQQRIIFEEDQLLIILHEPPKPNTRDRTHWVFFRNLQGDFSYNGQGDGRAMLKKLIANYNQKLTELDDAYDVANCADEYFDLMESLSPICRASKNFCSTLQSARNAIKEDSFLIAMRDEAEILAREFELLVTDAKMALEFHMAKHAEMQSKDSERMSKAQHKLNILAAMTFPIMAVSTIFGMNLHSGLEETPTALFWGVLLAGCMIGFGLKSWVTKKK